MMIEKTKHWIFASIAIVVILVAVFLGKTNLQKGTFILPKPDLRVLSIEELTPGSIPVKAIISNQRSFRVTIKNYGEVDAADPFILMVQKIGVTGTPIFGPGNRIERSMPSLAAGAIRAENFTFSIAPLSAGAVPGRFLQARVDFYLSAEEAPGNVDESNENNNARTINLD